jgi:hypothetical protein
LHRCSESASRPIWPAIAKNRIQGPSAVLYRRYANAKNKAHERRIHAVPTSVRWHQAKRTEVASKATNTNIGPLFAFACSYRSVQAQPVQARSAEQGSSAFGHQNLRPNHSVEARPNGNAPGPVWRYAVHFRQPGPGASPSVPPHLKR